MPITDFVPLRKEGFVFEAKQGYYIGVKLADLGPKDLIGAFGCRPCVGTIIVDDGMAYAFHFEPGDFPHSTLNGLRFGPNAYALVFGGEWDPRYNAETNGLLNNLVPKLGAIFGWEDVTYVDCGNTLYINRYEQLVVPGSPTGSGNKIFELKR